jgi:photosystem II stability/assembly factor-like uncharacterized protein
METWRFLQRALAGVAFLLGCSNGEGDPSGPAASIQVAVSPATLTLEQGQSGTVTLTLTRGGGFSGTVSVAVSGLPAGVTASVSPSPLTGATTSAIVTVTVGPQVAPGTYTATVQASAAGVGSVTATYQLTVTARPDFALQATPNAVSIEQGSSQSVQVGISRTNFPGAVALMLVTPPAGVSGTFAPASATGDNSQLTIAVAETVAPGSITLSVRGSGTPGERSTTIALTVTPKPEREPQFDLQVTGGDQLPEGGQLALTVSITRQAGFTGAVDLSVVQPLSPNLPQGITAAFSVDPVPSGQTQSTLTLSNAGAAVGDHGLVVRGTDPAGGTAAVDVQIEVPEPPNDPSGWTVVHDTPIPLMDLDFPTSSVGYTVGNDAVTSVMYKTADGGRTWSSVPLPAGVIINRVQFIDAMTGFVAGENKAMFRTIDGGNTWTDIGGAIPLVLDIKAIHFLDASEGYAGGGGHSLGRPSALVHTTNGGMTWSAIAGPWDNHVGNVVRAIHFTSVTDGVVSQAGVDGSPVVQHTTDGGQTWSAGTGTTAVFRNIIATAAVSGGSQAFSRTGPATWTGLGALPTATASSLFGIVNQGGALWVAGARSVLGSGVAVVARRSGSTWVLDFDGFGGTLVGGLADIVMFSQLEGVAVGVNAIIRRAP